MFPTFPIIILYVPHSKCLGLYTFKGPPPPAPVYKFLQNIYGWDGVLSAIPAEQKWLLFNCAEYSNEILVKTEKILSCFYFTRTSF